MNKKLIKRTKDFIEKYKEEIILTDFQIVERCPNVCPQCYIKFERFGVMVENKIKFITNNFETLEIYLKSKGAR